MALTLEVEVCRTQLIAEDVLELDLRGAGGARLPDFSPGSHIVIHLPSGLVRHYSLYPGCHNDGHYCVAVLRQPAGRGGSDFIHTHVRAGDRIKISAPANRFPLQATTNKALFIAGGIGITPIYALAKEFAHHSSNFEIVYLTKSKERTAFIKTLTATPFGQRLTLHHSDSDAGQRYDLASLLNGTSADTHVYCCGPSALMDVVKTSSAHIPSANLHFEAFAAEESAHQSNDTPFEIRLAKRGQRLAVGPNETILTVLKREGIPALYSCEEGTCGTCAVRVIEGIPDHRDSVLTAEERASGELIITCCSRAKSKSLVLDL